jgi:riboflavin synthase alpha subunit
MRESSLEFSRVELSIGDSVRVDDQILTVLDICGDEVTFRIETVESLELEDFALGDAVCYGDKASRFPPR